MDRVFLDTVFVQALLNRRDRYHAQAVNLLPKMRAAHEVVVSEAVLVEIGNGLSAYNRAGASGFIRSCYNTPNMRVVSISSELLQRAVDLYDGRPDKAWGLTDCISFVIMDDHDLSDAVTAYRHFQQAGFRALMLEEE